MRGARLLLVRSEHLGDILHTLPATVALRRSLPSARITYLTPPGLGDVAARCPAVDETMELPFPPVDAAGGQGWDAVLDEGAPRLLGRFDGALLFRPADPLAGTLTRAAGIPVRLGYLEPPTRPFLTAGVPHRPDLHAIEQAMEVVALAATAFRGRPPTPPTSPPLLVSERDRAEARGVLRAVGMPEEAAPVVVHPGVGWRLKAWPPSRWGRVAATLAEASEPPPVVTGSAHEAELVEATVAASGSRAVGLAGRLSLGGLAALLARARLVVASDSGPLHLAALLGAPVVGLYGPGSVGEAGPRPAGRCRVVRVPLPCSPCRTMTDPPCGASRLPRCVTETSVEQVVASAWDLLEQTAGARGGTAR